MVEGVDVEGYQRSKKVPECVPRAEILRRPSVTVQNIKVLLRHTREKKLRLLCLGVQMTPKVYLFLGMEFDKNFFVFNVLWVREFIAATAKCVTFTDDLEIQGHMLFYVTI